MSATVSDSRDEECWSAESFPPPQQLHLQKTTIAQKDAGEFTEKLEKFVTFSSRIIERKELNACPKYTPGLLKPIGG